MLVGISPFLSVVDGAVRSNYVRVRYLLVAQLEPASQVCGCLKPVTPLLVATCVGLKPPSPLRAGDVGKLKPSSPLLACARVGLKPSSPLRVRNGCFWRVFRLQRCHRFQRLLLRGEQW